VTFTYPAKPWQCPDPLEWGAYLLRPDMDLQPMERQPPMVCAVYGLFSAEGRLVYVGQTIQLPLRIKQHRVDSLRGLRGKFARYGYRVAPEHMLRDFEIAHIHALKPEQNYAYERPEWEPHEEMAGALRSMWGVPESAPRPKKPYPLWRLRCGLALPT
jgi:hypothetical protein